MDVRLGIGEGWYIRGQVEEENNGKSLVFKFPYNKKLIEEIKCMDGARYHGYDEKNPRKIWTVHNNERNRFQLDFLQGNNPYAPYDAELIDYESNRPNAQCTLTPYKHQLGMTSHMVTRRHCIVSAEMSTGKTLAAFEALEYLEREHGFGNFWWVGTKSSLLATQLEQIKWRTNLVLKLSTYEGLTKTMENWKSGDPAPQAVIFDECQKVKNPQAKRSQAAYLLACAIRHEWARKGLIILMSGSPAPKDPTDWYWLTEIACPGFLKEGNVMKFRQRLGLVRKEEGFGGGSYNKLVTWWDNSKKCLICGQMADHYHHDPMYCTEEFYHTWKPSVNEVGHLYSRLKGLTYVLFKKDCLDLPEKNYRIVKCEASHDTLNAADLIVATSKTAALASVLLRELSDGFQYKEQKRKIINRNDAGEVVEEEATTTCPSCLGAGSQKEYFDKNPNSKYYQEPLDALSLERGYRVIYNDEGVQVDIECETLPDGRKGQPIPLDIGSREITCDKCRGKKVIVSTERVAVQVKCPKEDALVDLLDEFEDAGRVVIAAGFQGSVDRCTKVCREQGWSVIRVDGRGWWSNLQGSSKQLLQFFDLPLKDRDGNLTKIAFVMQPGAGGIGLNLQIAPVMIYYSNTFKWEDRAQSEDRIHRPGMDLNRGCTIVDLIHLPSDLKVLENLKLKKELQGMTMGQLRDAVKFTNINQLIMEVSQLQTPNLAGRVD